jgi:beta-galactosidase
LLRELILPHAGLQWQAALPRGVEVARRAGKGRTLTFVLNHAGAAQTINTPQNGKNLLTGKTVGATLHLGPYEVAVIEGRK